MRTFQSLSGYEYTGFFPTYVTGSLFVIILKIVKGGFSKN